MRWYYKPRAPPGFLPDIFPLSSVRPGQLSIDFLGVYFTFKGDNVEVAQGYHFPQRSVREYILDLPVTDSPFSAPRLETDLYAGTSYDTSSDGRLVFFSQNGWLSQDYTSLYLNPIQRHSDQALR